jgi:hypothetical protein
MMVERTGESDVALGVGTVGSFIDWWDDATTVRALKVPVI